MLIRFEQLAAGETLDADLCIVGAGAAGISMARELDGSSLRVLLMESGGLELDSATQDLYRGESVGRPYFPLEASRLRYFGGTTNHWGGWSAPLDASDFERRDWVAHSGWPIDRETLDPWYRRAQEVCELGAFRYAAGAWQAAGQRLLDLPAAQAEHKIWHFSPTRFGTVYRETLRRSSNVRVVLGASATAIRTHRDGRHVTSIGFAGRDGHRAEVRARRFVLACGGIETPRLMLLSTGSDPRGVGNRHDLVGRYFAEHLFIHVGTVVFEKGIDELPAYHDVYPWHGKELLAGIGPSAAYQRERRILNSSITIEPVRELSEGYIALRSVLRDVRGGEWPDDLTDDLTVVMRDLDGLARTTQKKLAGRWDSATLRARSEQCPNPDSRVRLGDERDALGLRRSLLDWRLTELDKRTAREAARLAADMLLRHEIGRARIVEWLLAEDLEWGPMTGCFHHMGTTRMSESPSEGVVDRDCRVHGIDNLYVAGSSVFPTAGFMNPTLTIVALALRLADHLDPQILGA